MKKVFILVAIVGSSLTLLSFRNAAQTQANFDVVTNANEVEEDGATGSFTSSYDKGTDLATTWEKWHKYWTLTSVQDTKDISKLLTHF